jgi:dTMP kinase
MTFITFDGPEGSGKSTQVKLLRERAPKLFPNHEFVYTREPGGSPGAEEIRALFFNHMIDTSPRTQLGLMMAARFDHAEQIITPQLALGKVVVSDRYAPASYAYQVSQDPTLEPLFREHLKLVPKPDLSIILVVSPNVTIARLAERKGPATAFDVAGKEFHEAVENAYMKYHKQYGGMQCVVVNGYRDPEEVHEGIVALVKRVIPDQV